MLDTRKLRAAREKAGLSQAELARRVGVSQGLIWAIENGAKRPSIKVLARIAAELSLSLDELLPVVSDPKEATQ